MGLIVFIGNLLMGAVAGLISGKKRTSARGQCLQNIFHDVVIINIIIDNIINIIIDIIIDNIAKIIIIQISDHHCGHLFHHYHHQADW